MPQNLTNQPTKKVIFNRVKYMENELEKSRMNN